MSFKANTTAVEEIDLCFVSQGRVRTTFRRGGQFCSFVANFLMYPCAKNYENIVIFDEVIVEIIRVHFLPYSILCCSCNVFYSCLHNAKIEYVSVCTYPSKIECVRYVFSNLDRSNRHFGYFAAKCYHLFLFFFIGGGNGTGCYKVKVWADTAKIHKM